MRQRSALLLLLGLIVPACGGSGGRGGSPPLPAAPTGLSATPGIAKVVLTWNPVAGAISYNIYRATVPGITKANYSSLAGGTQISNSIAPLTHTGLVGG